ncbi:bifunctional 4-hydroxy-2-oxoglutarate aldolase/2-dehydro-3-deoxy-phosphogluconate aldolase [Labrenzia sp. PHM005]|uniref:bifunctional 4-hydroxy-2-oxoglutarate aldolase/2-dehydro-3-deoxy-phosphogluconate aldolase n=1 Tax=Labrenzia sp. PHM005 TaxID=2590016 RepID=UPI0011403E79|nr:bifunctional 4-hydroxy-2-oxoglutarate aldolase/2-dehydro-3-deoxy-phosphogluconate aldolase [Labrenzia sp. PHM005]QDG76742.1 bifunctional 4-hydroxy-2-oxoglutarate aldolase/2-dehydro-3-deoxy-phosphogluconate aldolase [Labrenzia sp. PHM005]
MGQDIQKIEAVMTAAPVIPVLVIEDPEKAVPMAEALVRGGLPAIEITLRTPRALEAIEAVNAHVEGAIAGAGTVLTPQQYDAAVSAGARFVVSPGATRTLLDAADEHSTPLLPGAATASEVMKLLERGYERLKFFPAEQAGGAAYLKSLSSPLAVAKFCPTGGVSIDKAEDYLKLPNVLCVGGSWIADPKAIAAEDWTGIEERARAAAGLIT